MAHRCFGKKDSFFGSDKDTAAAVCVKLPEKLHVKPFAIAGEERAELCLRSPV